MPEGPIRCPQCRHTDFFVISTGVQYENGSLLERYHWPSSSDDETEQLDEVFEANHVHDGGYQVEQQVLVEPEIRTIDGPVKALCATCLHDVTEAYLQLGRETSLPV